MKPVLQPSKVRVSIVAGPGSLSHPDFAGDAFGADSKRASNHGSSSFGFSGSQRYRSQEVTALGDYKLVTKNS